MKRVLEILAVLMALCFSAVAQSGYPERDRGYAGQWQGRISADDQKEFNHEYHEWQEANGKNDRHEINKHARKMEEIMARYNIPRDTPFEAIANSNGYSPRYNAREFQGR